ncbi:MAG: type II toxin-antitoxin system RelE/ParE family toxin [Oscillospiraceae bacterium]|nr:type II toxin-antitoxin system RelE/ParE family toxin [Oscillospiraceae bacterium]
MSRKYKITYSPDALDDLKDVYSYIAYNLLEKNTARDLVIRIRAEIKTLNRFPERYPLVAWEPWHSHNVRTLLVGNFTAYYSVNNETDTVLIGRVMYAGRDVEGMVHEGRLY